MKFRLLREIQKPQYGEFPTNTHIYMDLLPDDGMVLKHLKDNLTSTRRFISSIPRPRLLYRYGEGKWTIKEILGHVIDNERIISYRALRFARNDLTVLPGFDQELYARNSAANLRDIGDLLDEFTVVRRSTIAFFNSLEDRALVRSGVADKRIVSVRTLAYHIAGHELLHMDIIRERYL